MRCESKGEESMVHGDKWFVKLVSAAPAEADADARRRMGLAIRIVVVVVVPVVAAAVVVAPVLAVPARTARPREGFAEVAL